jgi:hypothetical protein
MVLVSTFLSLGGTDLSAYTSKVEVSAEVEEKDVTTFGSGGWKTLLGGLKSGGVAITWKNSIVVSELDSILWPLLGTIATFEVRGTSAVVGTSNPKYTGSLLVKALAPIGGSVGDVNEQSQTFPTSGAVSRATA